MHRHADFSEYIVFVDESGDHGLANIDADYPLFVLCFCMFRKRDYLQSVMPELTALKFRTFGHDNIVLHEHDMRKRLGAFSALGQDAREGFMAELTEVVGEAPFEVVAVAIDKARLKTRIEPPDNPYSIALKHGLAALVRFLREKGQENGVTHVLFECRGKREDAELELEFRRVCDGDNAARELFPLAIEMVDKKSNSPGLQIADMLARPIGLSILRPTQANRTRAVVENKFWTGSPDSGTPPGKWGFGLTAIP